MSHLFHSAILSADRTATKDSSMAKDEPIVLLDRNKTCDRNCPTLSFNALGSYPECTKLQIWDLTGILEGLNSYLPNVREYCDASTDSTREMRSLVVRTIEVPDSSTIKTLPDPTVLYTSFMRKIATLDNCVSLANKADGLCLEIQDGLKRHMVESQVPQTQVNNISDRTQELLRTLILTRDKLQATLWMFLEENPLKSQRILQHLFSSIRGAQILPDFTKIEPITQKDFGSIDIGGWINDEIINYFATKWTRESTGAKLLPLSTFFASKFLFEDEHCTFPRTVVDDSIKERVRKWANKTKVALRLTHFDRVFIPINCAQKHWFSVAIDYERKKIEIFDSLNAVYTDNFTKPIQEQKNATLMLVLIWLAEVLGSLRHGSESTVLLDNEHSGWTWNPHCEVPFQTNGYDCGVYVLWQLRHILELGGVVNRAQASPDLQITGNAHSKRIRLAQELLNDCSYHVFEQY